VAGDPEERSPLEKWAGRALFAAAALLLALSFSGLTGRGLKRGSVAPELTLQLLDGTHTTLAEGLGKPQALAFWATWCMPCRAELPSLDRLAQRYPEVRFVAVNVEDALMKPQVEAFVRATGLAMPVAWGGAEAGARYHAASIPHLVILDRAGKVSQTFTGVYESHVIAHALDVASAPLPAGGTAPN